jgi:hypothetical protein
MAFSGSTKPTNHLPMNGNTPLPFRAIGLSALLSLSLGQAAFATDYYISPTGNDANSGINQNNAWQTIDRANQLSFSLQPGDRILFKRGGTYRGELILGSNGSPASPVSVGAYGTGDMPVIKGSVAVTGWTNYQGSIWQADVAGQVDQVYLGGTRMTLARYPNAGWMRNSQGGGTQMQSNDLTQPNNYWTGAVAVVRSSSSSFDTLTISSYSNGTLHFTTPTLNMGNDPWGFYITKKLSELDSPGEWFFDAAQQKLYLWAPNGGNPNSQNVEAAVYRAGVNCYWQKHDMSITDIAFRHQRLAGVFNDGATKVTVSGCDFRELFHGIRSAGGSCNFNNNTFQGTYATGALVFDDNTTIADNTLTDIALLDGQGESTWGYFGIRTTGSGMIVRGNRMDNIGYIGIIAESNALIEKNVIHHPLATMNDGGGIAIDHADGLIIQDNIVSDPIGNYSNGAATNAPHNEHMGIGIYFGNTSIKNTIARRNTVYNCKQAGIHVDHTMVATGIQVKDNMLFNNGVQLVISDYSNATGAGAVPPYYLANFNDQYTGNTMYCLTKDQLCMLQYNTHGAQPVDFGTFSNNRYFNPYNELSIKIINFVEGAPRLYTLERWKVVRNEDAGSQRSPMRLTPYSTVQEFGGNLVANGNFASNVTGWTGWPNNAQVTRVTNMLDNGALKANLPDNSQYPSFTLHNPDLFAIQAQQWYRVRFSIQSNAEGDLISGVKGQSQFTGPYTTWQWQVPFSAERRDLELYFQSNLTDQAQVQFENQWTEPVYFLDNVEIKRVSVAPVDPSDANKVLVNEAASAQTMALPAGCWSNVQGTVLSDNVVVPAYGSVAIYELPADACDIATGVDVSTMSANTGTIHPNPAVHGAPIHFAPTVNARITLLNMNGEVVMDKRIPNGSTATFLPDELAPGVYVARITGEDRNETQKLVVQ